MRAFTRCSDALQIAIWPLASRGRTWRNSSGNFVNRAGDAQHAHMRFPTRVARRERKMSERDARNSRRKWPKVQPAGAKRCSARAALCIIEMQTHGRNSAADFDQGVRTRLTD